MSNLKVRTTKKVTVLVLVLALCLSSVLVAYAGTAQTYAKDSKGNSCLCSATTLSDGISMYAYGPISKVTFTVKALSYDRVVSKNFGCHPAFYITE